MHLSNWRALFCIWYARMNFFSTYQISADFGSLLVTLVNLWFVAYDPYFPRIREKKGSYDHFNCYNYKRGPMEFSEKAFPKKIIFLRTNSHSRRTIFPCNLFFTFCYVFFLKGLGLETEPPHVGELKRGRTSCKDEHCSGRPNEVTTTKAVKTIDKVVLDDRRLKVYEVADMVVISKSAVHRILTENLITRKMRVRWLPRFLTMKWKQHR